MSIKVYGATVDDETRCIHYNTEKDVVAIRFRCCDRYYPCHLCHAQAEDHEADQWALDERSEKAVLCGVCRTELSIADYLVVDGCPACGASFNEGCRLHTELYFQT